MNRCSRRTTCCFKNCSDGVVVAVVCLLLHVALPMTYKVALLGLGGDGRHVGDKESRLEDMLNANICPPSPLLLQKP